MKLHAQTLFSPAYAEVVRLTVCHSEVAILLLKYCIMQHNLLLSAEFIIKVTADFSALADL